MDDYVLLQSETFDCNGVGGLGIMLLWSTLAVTTWWGTDMDGGAVSKGRDMMATGTFATTVAVLLLLHTCT